MTAERSYNFERVAKPYASQAYVRAFSDLNRNVARPGYRDFDVQDEKFYHQATRYDGYWFHPDHLGTGTLITDLEGRPEQFFLNLPYGETFIEQGGHTYDNPYKFNGKELDEETGLYYYGARYYDPKISLWLSVDPLVEKYPGISPFAYTYGNPVRFVDPTGMEGEAWDYEFNFNVKTGKIEKISDKGGNEIDYINVGEEKNGEFIKRNTFVIGRNKKPLIYIFRFKEDNKTTLSAFLIPEINKSGFILEPGGPSTTKPNQDKRIPEGTYNLILSKDRPGVNAKILRFPNNFVLYNEQVSMWRGITLHTGNFHDQTEGCPMPAQNWSIGKKGDYNVTPFRIGYLRTTQSRKAYKIITNYIRQNNLSEVKIMYFNTLDLINKHNP